MNATISQNEMNKRIVRYGELKPCKTAFIDAHTPGSDQKENFTIIGGGVSESRDQHVHITDTPGFNIGAAGQPPNCKNSLHCHRTAEVFFVLNGRWKFYWGRWGTAGEVILEKGDIFNIPTGIFRGFENVGEEYGMIMAILGGDDAGGGVVWAPQVIEEAQKHGLMLGENGKLYDSKKNEKMPDDIKPMPTLTDKELKSFPEPSAKDVVPKYVARHWDMIAMAGKEPVKVIGETAMLKDKSGFEVDLITQNSIDNKPYSTKQHEVLMPVKGYWKLKWNDGETILNPGDTCAIPPEIEHSLEVATANHASMYRIRNTNDPAGKTWVPDE